jgi:exonuclease SbcC
VRHEVGDRESLKTARTDLEEQRRQEEQLSSLHIRAAELREGVERAAAELSRSQAVANEAVAADDAAGRGVEQAEAALHEVRHQDMALSLRSVLQEGEECPVCLQPLPGPPPPVEAVHMDAAERAVGEARARRQQATAVVRKAESEQARCSQQLGSLQDAAAEVDRQVVAAARVVADLERRTEPLLGTLRQVMGDADPEELLARAEEQLSSARHRLERAEEERAGAEAIATRRAHELESAQVTLHALARERETLETQIQAIEHEIAADRGRVERLEEDVRASLGQGEASQLLAAARQRVGAAQADLERAEARDRQQRTDLEHARRAAEQASAAADEQEKRLLALAGSLGHRPDADTPWTLEGLFEWISAEVEQQSRSLAGQQEQNVGRLERIAEERAGLLSGLDLEAAADFERVLNGATTRHAGLVARCQGIEQRLRGAAALSRELAEAQEQVAIYRHLVSDLGARRFASYLLDEERAALTGLGSRRLHMLTGGRYRFAADGSFDVLDAYSADARRDAKTLSGGETFLASLALALALAERVTQSGGRLDAFFLDEGFGSLDPPHLDLAMDGIERLVADAPDRLVVLVSHIDALRDRVDDLIRLDKDSLTGHTVVV